tara:strand:+ start:130 stop:654 length:525 start_codon:yes stop_codon:yes gene_type:complete
MSRNIVLSFDEWTEIRKELGIKKERCTITNELEDEHWNFKIYPYPLKEWKKRIRAYKKKGWVDYYCFERTGVYRETLENLKSQHLINTLCKQEWREWDFNNFGIFEIEEEYNFYHFLGWLYNARLKEELDIYTPREKLYRIWEIMSKTIRLKSEKKWFNWDLEKLADEVIMSIC